MYFGFFVCLFCLGLLSFLCLVHALKLFARDNAMRIENVFNNCDARIIWVRELFGA